MRTRGELERTIAILRPDDVEAVLSEMPLQEASDAGLGLCDQDSGHGRDRSATAATRPDVLCAALATNLAQPDLLVVPAPPPGTCSRFG